MSSSVDPSNIAKNFDEKLAKFREELMNDIRKEIREEFKQHITQLESTVTLLRTHVDVLKKACKQNAADVEELEQYGRRLCLRVDGIPTERNELAEKVLDKMSDVLNKANLG